MANPTPGIKNSGVYHIWICYEQVVSFTNDGLKKGLGKW